LVHSCDWKRLSDHPVITGIPVRIQKLTIGGMQEQRNYSNILM
jgi:hypothetical protein